MYFDSTGGAAARLQLCSRGLRDNVGGTLAEFALSELILFIVLQQQKMATLHILAAALFACAVNVNGQQGLFDIFSLVSGQ